MIVSILLTVKSEKKEVTPKYFRYDNMDEGIEYFKHFVEMQTEKRPLHIIGLGNFWLVGNIELKIDTEEEAGIL